MEIFILNNASKIARNKKVLEKKLKTRIIIEGKKITLLGDGFNQFVASKVIEALEANFTVPAAMLLAEEDFILEHLNIKEISRRNRRSDVRARVIGKKGRTMEIIGELSDCYITLNDNIVSIIGPADKIEIALHALKALIRGSKQSSVYAYLEKKRKMQRDDQVFIKDEEEDEDE